VAEAIFSVLPGEKVLKPIEEVDTLAGFDLVFLGFPVMQFGTPSFVKKFLATHAAGKRIALYVTHAMLSNSTDPHQQVMLEKELQKCRAACAKSKLTGLFHCQGELSEAVARELINSNIPMLSEFASMRPLTTGHPDENELEQAKAFAREMAASRPASQPG
jgi:hypothetical protein